MKKPIRFSSKKAGLFVDVETGELNPQIAPHRHVNPLPQFLHASLNRHFVTGGKATPID
jgi:hypothetical protein